MMNDDEYGCWDLSLSLRPPIIHPHHFHTDEQKPKMHEPNNGLMIVPKIMGVEMRPAELVIDLEEEIVVTKVFSPNSTLSTASGKRLGGERDANANSDEDDGGTTTGGQRRERKKLRLSKEQIMVLEQAFRDHATPTTKQKMALANQVNLRPRQVEVWFQNRRARTKLKQTEVDCEYLRRFCDTLSEENRKLQKELHDMRALKVSPDYPSSSLSMCHSCNCVCTTATATTKAPTEEMGPYPVAVFHPLNLNKLSLSSNSSRTLESHVPRV